MISILAFAKYIGSHPDHCASLFNGDRIIVAHSHGQDGEIPFVLEVGRLQLGEKPVQLSELFPDLGLVCRQGSHAHDSADGNMGQFRQCVHEGTALFHAETMFGFFFCHVDFQQYPDDPIVLCRLFLNLL